MDREENEELRSLAGMKENMSDRVDCKVWIRGPCE